VNHFVVVVFLFHHYQVENLKYVSILSRTRLIVETEHDRDHLMFVYVIKRGF
jgi:hypothetical protein